MNIEASTRILLDRLNGVEQMNPFRQQILRAAMVLEIF